MELRRAALVFTLAAGSQLFAAEAGIEFSGVLTAEGTTRIALTDVATRSTTWVRAGDIFNGYTVARYDAKEDAVLLTKGGQELRLRLELPKTPDAGRPNSAVAANPPNAAATNPASAASPSGAPTAPAAATTVATSSAPPAGASTPASSAPGGSSNPPAVAATPPAPTAQPTPPVPANSAPPAASTAALPPVPESLPPTGRQTASPSYTIQGGDTLDSIALTQGVTVQQIRELNPALNSTSLRAGDTIRIR